MARSTNAQPLLHPVIKIPDTHRRQRNHRLPVAINASTLLPGRIPRSGVRHSAGAQPGRPGRPPPPAMSCAGMSVSVRCIRPAPGGSAVRGRVIDWRLGRWEPGWQHLFPMSALARRPREATPGPGAPATIVVPLGRHAASPVPQRRTGRHQLPDQAVTGRQHSQRNQPRRIAAVQPAL